MAAARKGGIGDNVDAEKKKRDQAWSLFMHHTKKRMNHNAELKAIRDDKKNDGLLAKADGITLEDMDFAIEMMETADTALPRAKYIRQGEILAMLNLITPFNPDTVLADRQPADERIQNEGQVAGGLGLDRQSPYAADSKETQDWLTGYDRGRAIYLDNIADALEAADNNRAKAGAAVKKKATKGGEPLSGDLPPEANTEPEKPAETSFVAPKPEKPAEPNASKPAKPDAKPKKPTKAEVLAAEKTKAELEAEEAKAIAEKQANPDFN